MAGNAPMSSSIINKVNVTPIIDVALVLVIILLVTAPMMTVSDMPVTLPEAHSRGAEDERNLSITLGPNGELAIDRDTVAAQDFGRTLREQLAKPENAEVLVVVRADAGAQYTRVGEILEEARAAGAQRLAIATRQAAVSASMLRASQHRAREVAPIVAPPALMPPPVAPPEAGR
jgi:biopolymer transport protein TolR